MFAVRMATMVLALLSTGLVAGVFYAYAISVMPALAAAVHLGREQRSILIWLGIALALNVIAFAVTAGLNVPLNDALAAAGDPASIADTAAVRADFEATWVRWNIVRAVLHTAAFLVLCGALFAVGVQQGKSSSTAEVAAAPVSMVYGR